jgi:sulfide:quinone oxidoreductase
MRASIVQIKGLPAAFDTPGVCSNYSVDTVGKTWTAFQQFTTGNALFTFPNPPIKCAGAPQKICYLFDAYLRKVGAHRRRTHSTHNSQNNKRQNAEIYYNTALPVIFGIPKYAAALNAVVKDRDIHLQTRHVLKEIRASSSEAVFDVLDEQMKPTSEKVQKVSVCACARTHMYSVLVVACGRTLLATRMLARGCTARLC